MVGIKVMNEEIDSFVALDKVNDANMFPGPAIAQRAIQQGGGGVQHSNVQKEVG